MGVTYKREERRISLLGAAIFAVITVIAGLVVYIIMQRQAEFILGATLELSLQSRASLFEAGIGNSLDNSTTIVTRPFIILQIKKINQSPGDVEARHALQRAATSFLPTGLSAVAISGVDGKEIAQAGSFVGEVALQTPIASPYQVTLLWKDGFVLRARIGIFDQGTRIGSIRTEAKLDSLISMLFETKTLGKSGELAVCAPLGADMRCFPTKLFPDGMLRHSRDFANHSDLPLGDGAHRQRGSGQAQPRRPGPAVVGGRHRQL